MALPRRFLHTQTLPFPSDIKKIILGIVFGLGLAVTLYSLLYMFREGWRLITITEHFDLLVLTDKEVRFYNLIFAFTSVLLGQSACLSFWMKPSSKRYGKYNRKFTSAIGDMCWNLHFLNWGSRMGIAIAVSIVGIGASFNFYPDYTIAFIILFVVLFLQPWVTLRRIYKNRCLVWMGYSLIIVSAVSAGLSFVDIIDYKAINSSVRSNSPFYGYGLELPRLDPAQPHPIRGRISAFVAMIDNDGGEPGLLYKSGQEFEPYIYTEDFGELVKLVERDISGILSPRLHFIAALMIDKDILMSDVNRLKSKLSKARVSIVYYVFDRVGTDQKVQEGLPLQIPLYYGRSAWEEDPSDCEDDWLESRALNHEGFEILLYSPSKSITIFPVAGNVVELDGEIISLKELQDKIKPYMAIHEDCMPVLRIYDQMKYGEYIELLNTLIEANREMRDDMAQEKYGVPYDILNSEQQWEIQNIYPLRYFELTDNDQGWLDEMKERIKRAWDPLGDFPW